MNASWAVLGAAAIVFVGLFLLACATLLGLSFIALHLEAISTAI
jgi:hypothetical protein